MIYRGDITAAYMSKTGSRLRRLTAYWQVLRMHARVCGNSGITNPDKHSWFFGLVGFSNEFIISLIFYFVKAVIRSLGSFT